MSTASTRLTGKTALAHLRKHDEPISASEMKNLAAEEREALVKTLNSWSVGFYDIETTALHGDIGMILCACIKEAGSNRIITIRKDKTGDVLYEDSKMAKKIADELSKFDMIVTFFGHEFDFKMFESRLAHYDRRFKPRAGNRSMLTPMHVDLYFTGKKTFNLHDGKLDTLARHLRIKTRKTHLDWEIWRKAAYHHSRSMDYVVDHCEKDVLVLEQCFMRMKQYVRSVWRRG